jgi:SAM-dependent methyltransferase
MEPLVEAKPAHLGDSYAQQFCDSSVVEAYPYRLPYPPAVFPLLAGLIAAPPRRVLDVGCGPGDIARSLAPLVGSVDAVDVSAAMIALGRTLSGGDYPGLRWILGRAEDAALAPSYGLVTAGESLHWMLWDLLLPRLRSLLVPGGVIALIERREAHPWDAAAQELITRYSTNRDFRPYDLVDELVRRRLFTPLGEVQTEPVVVRQTVAAYVESIHSRNGFSRDRMTVAAAAGFDRELAALVAPYAEHGELVLQTVGRIRWGAPLAAQGWRRDR